MISPVPVSGWIRRPSKFLYYSTAYTDGTDDLTFLLLPTDPRVWRNLQAQAVKCLESFSGPESMRFGFEIYSVPLGIQVREQQQMRLCQPRDFHCVCEFEMFFRRLIAIKRAF